MRPLPLLVLCLIGAPAAAQCPIPLPRVQPAFPSFARGGLSGDVLALSGSGDRFALFERTPAGWQQSAFAQLDVWWVFEPLRIALDGERLAVAAPEDGATFDDLRGSLWVYERGDGWQTPRRVVPDVPADEDFLGWSIDLAGDVLVAGAPQKNSWLGQGPGHALVFEFDGSEWSQVADLHPHGQGTSAPSEYATVLATDGETLAVGAWSDMQAGTFAGAVYVYERTPSGWVEVAKLLPPAPVTTLGFGYSVAVEGDTLAVCDVKQLHVFERGPQGWMLSQTLPPVDPLLVGAFGLALDLDGDDLAVGAPSTDVPFGANNVGALHVYRRGPAGWGPAAALLADDAPGNAWLGRSVAVDDGAVLWVGVLPEARLLDLGLGRVSALCDGSPNSTGTPATLAAQGCDSLLADSLAIVLAQAPPNVPVWLRVGTAANERPFGNGTLCVAGPPFRIFAGGTSSAGAKTFELDLAGPPFDTWDPGGTAFFQAVFLDAGFGSGGGTSAALALELQP